MASPAAHALAGSASWLLLLDLSPLFALWFEIKNISEGVASVEALPKEYRGLLVTAIAEAALTKKADAVNLTKDLFAQVAAKDVMTHDALVAAFEPIFKTLVDTAIDAPSAYAFAATLLVGIGATEDEVEALKGKMESEEGDEEVEYGRESFDGARKKVLAA
ncbi:hypothetical protein JCM9279_001952 [Rhodotorula babjevae]